MIRPWLTLALACALLVPAAADARTRHRRTKPVAAPVLVELYTAQGCEGCPQADLALADMAKKKGIVALSFSVDIWDYTGWTDTFAQPEFTERQKAYVKRLKLREMYTPEVVVNGAAEAAGSDKAAVAALLAKPAPMKGPKVSLSEEGDRVSIASGRAANGAADVWLIRYDPKLREVKVKAGDNRGKTVIIANGVKELVKLGQWRSRQKRFDLPDASVEGLKTIVLVQTPRGGPVLSMAKD
jgi:hypothetical protein